MVICGACGQCRECLDRKLTNACPLSNPRISRQASLRYLCNYMKRWNTWPLTRFSLHVFSQLNWLATDIRKKKSVKKIWKKSRVERGHDFSVTEEVVHSILWCTQSTYTKQWQTDSSSRNELKDWTIVLQFLQMNIKPRLIDYPYLWFFCRRKKKSPFPLIFRICRKIGNAFSWFDFMPRIIVTDFFRF